MTNAGGRVKVAAVQAASVVLDLGATLEKLNRLTQQAADGGARIVVFPEAFVPAYPCSQVFGPVFGGFTDAKAGPAFERLVENSVDVPGPATEAIGRAAKKARAHLSVGVNERTKTGTLHCTLLLFSPQGELLQARRKLVEIEGFLTRQEFKSVVDDEWQFGPKLSIGRTYGNHSEISFGYQLTDRQFDTREPRTASGDLVLGKSLEFFQHELFAVWRHHWDQQRRWRTVTRLSLQRNDDNEAGRSHDISQTCEPDWRNRGHADLDHRPARTPNQDEKCKEPARAPFGLTRRHRACVASCWRTTWA
jgi:hypothetical protein